MFAGTWPEPSESRRDTAFPLGCDRPRRAPRSAIVANFPPRGGPMRLPPSARASIRVEDERGAPLTLPSGRAYPPGSRIKVEAGRYRASIATEGYVSGVAAGSFVDTETGARDPGFGLGIVAFLLEPAEP